jgi:hypothetical protein
VDHGATFLIIGASITRQFEFLQRAWVNDGDLVGLGTKKDPLIGPTTAPAPSPSRANRCAGG